MSRPPASQDLPPEEVPASDDGLVAARQRLVRIFLITMFLAVVVLVWMAVRDATPVLLRTPLDFVMQIALAGALAYASFRALFLFPFRMPDLMALVIVLSLAMKGSVDFLRGLAIFGFLNQNFVSDQSPGVIVQVCLLTGTVLVLGAAFGLRNCYLLKIDAPLWRVVTVVAGTLVLPAAAGVISFPIWLLREVVLEEQATGNAPFLILFWLGSIFLTLVNFNGLVKTMTLQAQITSREKMP